MQVFIGSSEALDPVAVSMGLLAVRVVLGAYMMAHGAQKLFGWFGGHGLAVTSQFFEQIGFRPARALAGVASVTEVASGLLVALGLFGPVGPALMLSVLVVAIGAVHWPNGWFAMSNGIEHAAIFAAGALALALSGPGLFSLDALFGLEALWSPGLAGAAIATGLAGGVANLAARRPMPQPVTNRGS